MGINHDLHTNFKTFFFFYLSIYLFIYFSLSRFIAIATNTHVHSALMAPALITYSLPDDLTGSPDAFPPLVHAALVLDMWTSSSCVCPPPRSPLSPHKHTHPHPLYVCTSALELTPGFSQLHAVRQNVSSLGVANRKEGRHLREHNRSVSSVVTSFIHLFDFLTNQISSIFV